MAFSNRVIYLQNEDFLSQQLLFNEIQHLEAMISSLDSFVLLRTSQITSYSYKGLAKPLCISYVIMFLCYFLSPL